MQPKLTQGTVARTLVVLSVPMLGGIFSAVSFNLADTYFVSRLGTRELAAMSFTFPVVMVLMGIAWGLGTGTTSVVARSIGRGDQSTLRRLSSDSLTLSFGVVFFFAGIGMLTISPLFTLLGASPDILPLIRDYMMIWYPGIVFLVIPMVANASIRATGDTKFPALIMIAATGTNFILDPLFIFGWFGFPRMEIKGAAVATVIARGGTMVASLLILHFRDRMLDFSPPDLKAVWRSWKTIAHIAVPASATNIMTPLAVGAITRMVAGYGPEAVAAWGAGSRITMFTLVPVFALCSGLVPFIGQNWGAERFDRVALGRKYGYVFAAFWGVLSLVVLHLAAEPIARLFSHEAEVVREIVRYLWIMPIGYAALGILSVIEETLNAIGKPVIASVQTLVYTFGFYLPLGVLGSNLHALTGLLSGLAAADLLGGLVGMVLVRWICLKGERICRIRNAESSTIPAG